MKQILIFFLPMLFIGAVSAQETTGPTFAPVDIFTCNYTKGKGRADLDKVMAKWNNWMDSSDTPPFSAWLLTPDYNSPDYPFDIGLLGAWENGKSMGLAHDLWHANGGAVAKEFASVINCSSHANMASMNLKSGPSENADSAVLSFTDCSVKEGHKMSDVTQAMGEWLKYQGEQGSVASSWLFFPAFGADTKYDFKRISAHPNYAELGLDYDRYGNGGGFVKAEELMDDKLSCGNTRIYHADRVRDATPND